MTIAWVGKFAVECETRSSSSPHSAVTRLIERVYADEPEQALRILRARIRTDAPLTPACRETVRVSAKSVEEVSIVPDEIRALCRFIRSEPRIPLLPFGMKIENPITALRELETRANRNSPHRATHDRPIAAILLDGESRVLASGVNRGSQGKIRHAERELLTELWDHTQKGIPIGSTLWVSLKPCRMCAAWIVQCAQDPANFQVRYLADDPGRLARNTALDQVSQGLQWGFP